MKPMEIAQVMDAKKQTVWNRIKRAEVACGDLISVS
jgi:DNA-directed RNA polymerase specialized sigma24 family protein